MTDRKSTFIKSPVKIPKIKEDDIESLEQSLSDFQLRPKYKMDSMSVCDNPITPRESAFDSSSASSTFTPQRNCSTPCNGREDASKSNKKSMNLFLPINVKSFLTSRRNSYLRKPSTPSSVVPLPLKLENTYRIEPNITFKSKAKAIQDAVNNVLKTHLKKVKYSPDNCGELARNLSTIVKNKLKELIPARYKIICQTFIGEQRGQGIEIATRCLWSTSTDSCEVVNFKNDSIIATVIIHGIYFE